MKAYKVTAVQNDISIIVFAKTANEAKKIGMGNNWFEDEEYTDMRARQEKWADQYYEKNIEIFDFCTNANLFLKNDWFCFSVNNCGNNICAFKKDLIS